MYLNNIPAYNFSGNMPAITLRSDQDVTCELFHNEISIYDFSASPDALNTIVLDLKEVIEDAITDPEPEESFRAIDRFRLSVSGHSDVTFRVLKGGIGADVDLSSWLRLNWLTWRPKTGRAS